MVEGWTIIRKYILVMNNISKRISHYSEIVEYINLEFAKL